MVFVCFNAASIDNTLKWERRKSFPLAFFFFTSTIRVQFACSACFYHRIVNMREDEMILALLMT